MSDVEKLEMLKNMTGETNEDVLLTYLRLAGEKVLHKAYPFCSDKKEVPAKYSGVQVEIACYLLNKRGAEGENYHSENGINRTYESASVPDSMLESVTPFCGVVG